MIGKTSTDEAVTFVDFFAGAQMVALTVLIIRPIEVDVVGPREVAEVLVVTL